MSEFSPTTQAVLDAFRTSHTGQVCLAAALRAAAYQVVPDQGDIWTRDLRGDAWIRWEERKLIRRDLLAIAHELETND